jgi:hypothetical protein
MGKTHLPERASSPQQVQRICTKDPRDAVNAISSILSSIYTVSKGNRGVLGDWFKAKNVP